MGFFEVLSLKNTNYFFQACVNFECVNASYLQYSCDVKQKCNDNGVSRWCFHAASRRQR